MTTNSSLLPREWISLSSSNHLAQNFTVMQFNALADGLGFEDFIHCPQDSLKWENRKSQILEVFFQNGEPDVILLEEINHFPDFFQPNLLKKGYHGVFIMKRWSPCTKYGYPSDGCALFYKIDKFESIESKKVYLDNGDGQNSSQRNQNAIIQLLKFRNNPSHLSDSIPFICFAVTHLKAKKTEAFEAMRLFQMKYLVSEIESFCKLSHNNKYKLSGIILGGDFNSMPNSSVYSFVSKTNILGTSLSSAYCTILNHEPSFTTWKFRPNIESKQTIDYIFYGSLFMRPIRVLDIPNENIIGPKGLPCIRYPSDHLSILTEFEMLY